MRNRETVLIYTVFFVALLNTGGAPLRSDVFAPLLSFILRWVCVLCCGCGLIWKPLPANQISSRPTVVTQLT